MGEQDRLERAEAVYRACRVTDRLFAMNPYLPQQNFYSQQLRALALVEVLSELQLQEGWRSVVVVGAGIAGRTLAAAFSAVGANVRLVEARERPFERYRNAQHRELHPNIIFWPYQDPVPATALPFLNWAQSSASDVTENLDQEWQVSFGPKVEIVIDEALAIRACDDDVRIDLKTSGTICADMCVLAMGFGDEKSIEGIKSAGYWSPDGLPINDNNVMVSGSGDGGLIDILAPIFGVHVTRAAHRLAVALADSPLRQDILETEKKRAERLIPGTRDSEDDCVFYTKVAVPPGAVREIEGLRAADDVLAARKVTLLHSSTSPYSFTAAPINKLLMAHFSNAPRQIVKTIKGSLQTNGAKNEAVCDDGTSYSLDPPCAFEKVLLRHGAHPGIAAVLSRDELDALRDQAELNPQAAMIEGYNLNLYKWGPRGMGKSSVRPHAMPKSVRRALWNIGLAYMIDMQIGPIGPGTFDGSRDIVVELSIDDQRKADELRLFPLRIGPAKVKAGRRVFRRNRPDEE